MRYWLALGALSLASVAAYPQVEKEPPRVYSAQLEAAESGQLHLVLDPKVQRLGLCVENVLLKSFPIVKGRVKGLTEGALGDVVFILETSLPEPERPDLTGRTSEDPSAAARSVLISVWREGQLNQSPTEYSLDFRPGLRLVVQPSRESTWEGDARWWLRRLKESWQAMERSIRNQRTDLEVEIVLNAEMAQRLYQALVPEMILVIAPGGLASYR